MKRNHLVIAIVIAALCALMAVPAANAATAKPAQVKGVAVKATSATSLKVTWKAVAKAKGYKVRYSTKSSMAGAKTVTVKGAKKKAKTLTKLSGCTTYYVQVRAYKSAKVLGKWSAKKAVKRSHVYKAKVTKPTCTAKGYTTYTCSTCGKSYKGKYTAALGHEAAEAVNENVIAPTCENTGSHEEVVYCSVCGEELQRDSVTDAALGHDLVYHPYKAYTCTEVGWNAYYTCSRCDYSTTYKEIPARGHILQSYGAKAPTCIEAGWDAYECCLYQDCDYTTYHEIPALGHACAGVCTRCNEISYTWAELKAISAEIGACETEEAALEKAQEYGLLASDGKLTGNEVKSFTLTDGTECQAQILGFWQDTLTVTGGKAGITFGFKNFPKKHAMNSTDTVSGGWDQSEMRSWLNDESEGFYALLPSDLKSQIASVEKSTNNVGQTSDAASVTVTSDKLWLLSQVEVYGDSWLGWTATHLPAYAEVYAAEGSQYKLYSDNGAVYDGCDILSNTSTAIWWLRSVCLDSVGGFHGVCDDGSYDYSDSNDSSRSVCPAFCL